MPESFAFRARAYSAAHFEFEEVLTVNWPDAEAKLQSEYTGGDDGRAYPVTIHGEIRGPGESVEEAQSRFAPSLANTLPLLAIAANAAIADPLAVSAHGLDLTNPQPFIGYRTPGAKEWFPPGKRRIDLEATAAFVHAVVNAPHADLLQRAIESYRRSLSYWIPEQLLLAGAFLYISAETLSRFLIESRASAKGITPKNLAQLEKAASPDGLRHAYLTDEVFAGDDQAFEAMATASNGFEHGYLAIDDVRGLLEPVLARSMGHVRRALIAASGLAPDSQEALVGEGYEEPRGLVPVISVVMGELARVDSSQPAEPLDWAAVDLEWEPMRAVAKRAPSGEATLDVTNKATVVKLPLNTNLQLSRTGFRAAYVKPTSEPLKVEIEVTRADGERR